MVTSIRRQDQLASEAGVLARAGDLFQLLRDGKARTRAELAELTGLARTTVAARIDALTSLGLVGPAGEAASSGGRPPSKFVFNATVRLVLAADVGASHAAVAVTDLNGMVLARHKEALDVADGPEAVLDWVLENGHKLLAEIGRSAADIAGIGIGLPGPVEHGTGKPVKPPIMPGWDGFDVVGYIRRDIDAEVLVDNDVNIMALGERHAHWSEYQDVLFIKLATGVGAGIISSGELQRGADGTSGDLGHVRVPGGEGVLCRCGNTGCLEALASGQALAAKLAAQGIEASSGSDVVDLAAQGNVNAIHALRQAGRDVGEVLAICVNMLNPSVIVVGGSLSRAGDQLLAGIREAVYGRSLPLATAKLRIEQSRATTDAAILGASRMVIEHVLSPAVVESAVAAALRA
ncbi:ROK family transcriptional regulator [Arthrobacter sp. CJ23]|uniref:ROK family transcriptional regulator n=1 Tax=Arthrobacter sp. CJ23 TaxID=2972479 RepID=UPI00215C6CF4|nr:ROK family transcriptional regulator [Arthrobacter sp. CJ23]UVJ40160.1 ROK family transcriptional regulator [Arthrobacter sp. CJ23]